MSKKAHPSDLEGKIEKPTSLSPFMSRQLLDYLIEHGPKDAVYVVLIGIPKSETEKDVIFEMKTIGAGSREVGDALIKRAYEDNVTDRTKTVPLDKIIKDTQS